MAFLPLGVGGWCWPGLTGGVTRSDQGGVDLPLPIRSCDLSHDALHVSRPIKHNLRLLCYVGGKKRIAAADPGFPRGGGGGCQLPRGGTNIRFCQIFPKTAWNRKNLGARGGRGAPCASPKSATELRLTTIIKLFTDQSELRSLPPGC